MDLTLAQLRAVVAVHDAGSFTAAATDLHLAQSSLSRTVAEVERRMGAALFDRTTRRVEPTAAGAELVAAARRALAGVAAELRHVDGFLAGLRGRLRIAALPSLAGILLPGVVSAYRAERPDVALVIEDALADEVLERVRSGRADLAVTVAPAPGSDDLAVTPVATDRFCLVAPAGHDLAGHPGLPWSALSGQPFIAFDPTTSIRQHVDRALLTAGATPRQAIVARNIAAVAGLVAAGLGVSVVPGLVVPLTGFAGLVAVPLREPVARRRIAVVRSRAHTPGPPAAAFVTTLTGAGRPRPALPAHATWT